MMENFIINRNKYDIIYSVDVVNMYLKNAYMHVSHSSHGSPLHITGTWLRNHNGYITSSWDIKGNVKD